MKKVCVDCEESKTLDEFPSAGNGRLKTRCKLCYNAYTKYWRENLADKDKLRKQWREASKRNYTPEKRRAATLSKYGLTESEYQKILDSQNKVCLICGSKPEPSQRGLLWVDHCHATGKIRGLLCDRCNTGLGCFADDIGRLNAAIQYLERAR